MKNFESEQQAIEKADKEVRLILANKTFINPERFSQLLGEFQKKQHEYNAEITVALKNQIESIQSSKVLVEECVQNISNIQETFIELDNYWNEDIDFHEETKIYEKVVIYKKNVTDIMEQFDYFVNISDQLDELEDLLGDRENYEIIQYQLIYLNELRETLFRKAGEKQDNNRNEHVKALLRKFEEVDQFEQKFYSELFRPFDNLLETSRDNPGDIIKTVKIILNADKRLNEKQKPEIYKEKMIQRIKQYITQRFKEQFKGKDEMEQQLEAAKFTISDLMDVYDHVQKLFPQEMEIFKIFQVSYLQNIQELITPYIQNDQIFKDKPGSLVYLVGWLDGYSLLLQRAGIVNDTKWIELESKIKQFLPDFIEYIQGLLEQWFDNALKQDRQYQTNEYLEELDKNNQQIVTAFPEDLFMCLNQQLDNIGGIIKGEVYLETIKAWIEVLNRIQKDEKEHILQVCDSTDLLKVCLFVNNYHKCIMHLKETIPRFKKFGSEQHEERLDNITSDLVRNFTLSIHDYLLFLCDHSFEEIESEVVGQLFTQKWKEGELIQASVLTIDDYLNSYKKWIVNQLYVSQTVKLCFKRLADLYFEEFLLKVKEQYGIIQQYKPTILKQQEEESEKDSKKKKKKKKKKKQENEQEYKIISNIDDLVNGIQHDIAIIKKSSSKSYGDQLGQLYAEKIEGKFKVLVQLLSAPRSDISSAFKGLYNEFKEQSLYVLEAAFTVRGDIDQNLFQKFLAQFNELYNK